MESHYPILEYDPSPLAIIEPGSDEEAPRLPAPVVLCFFQEIIQELVSEGSLTQISEINSEMGANPLYQIDFAGQAILVFQPGVGAPLSAGFLEEVIAMGGKYFIVCGGCGVLDKKFDAGHPFIIESAIRDEGTSYHYLPPAREVNASPQAVSALEETCRAHRLEYSLTKSWTTDAIYRETDQRRAMRINEGCQIVEMEASALFAVAQFRQVTLGQIVYAGDVVIPEGWDGRKWNARKETRRFLFQLALEAVGRLASG
ncbi:MAG: nucleoside phosphorylase [Anaerolineaceae bacterium]